MNKRIVFYGEINNEKKNALIKLQRDYLRNNKGNKFYYILPNGKLIHKYRKILLEDVKGVFDLNVFTFDDVMNKVFNKDFYTSINSEIKQYILHKILKDLYKEGKLNYYKNMINMEGFVKDISYIISEIKRSLITAEEFNKNAPKTPLYQEIGLVYAWYQKFLDDNSLLDVEESLLKGLEMLKSKKDFLNKLDFIVIDEFFEFRPQELEILKEINKQSLDIYINIPYKRDEKFEIVEKTLNTLRKMGFKIVEVQKGDKNLFETIGENLFTKEDLTLSETDKVKLIKAPNKYLELKRISQEIKTFYNEGVPLNEIGIVLTNPSEYLSTMFTVFKEEGIPCSLDEDIRLIDVPLVKEFLNIIELKINKFNKNNVIKRIKNSYFNIYSGRDKDKIEYILHRLNYKNAYELQDIIIEQKEKISKMFQDEKTKERYEQLENMESSIERLIQEGELIYENDEVEKIVDILINIVDSYDIVGKINYIYEVIGDYDIFHRDISALCKLRKILEKLKMQIPLIYDEINIENFYDILLKSLEEEIIIGTLGNSEGVNILTLSTLLGLEFEVLFITGLVDGKYPDLKEENFLFREENYSELKEIGLNVNNFYEKLDKESLFFTIGVTRSNRQLYLSYPESSLQDEVNIPSIFLDEFLSLFPEEKIDTIELDMNYLIKDDLKEITTKEEFINHLLCRYFEGEEVKDYIHMFNSFDKKVLPKINEKIECEIYRNKEMFNEYSGFIGDEEIIKDLSENQKDSVFSITHFETYGKCPYKFLMERILKLEGMERFIEEFSPLDKGNIFHKVLKDYYSFHKKDILFHVKGEKIFEVEDTLPEINKRIEVILKNDGLKILNNLWKIRIENMSNTILNLVKKDLERLATSKYKMVPYDFEVGFGYGKEFGLDIGDKKINILGKIDRIDKFLDYDKYVLYDYKTSSFGVKKVKDIEEGVSFQLPVYIMSQKDKNIIAGGYIDISKAKVYMELVQKEEKELVNKRSGKGVLEKVYWNDLMQEVENTMKEYIEKIYNGNFSINPNLCDSYCDFKEICRYQFR